jgi:hypothetical protein
MVDSGSGECSSPASGGGDDSNIVGSSSPAIATGAAWCVGCHGSSAAAGGGP